MSSGIHLWVNFNSTESTEEGNCTACSVKHWEIFYLKANVRVSYVHVLTLVIMASELDLFHWLTIISFNACIRRILWLHLDIS